MATKRTSMYKGINKKKLIITASIGTKHMSPPLVVPLGGTIYNAPSKLCTTSDPWTKRDMEYNTCIRWAQYYSMTYPQQYEPHTTLIQHRHPLISSRGIAHLFVMFGVVRGNNHKTHKVVIYTLEHTSNFTFSWNFYEPYIYITLLHQISCTKCLKGFFLNTHY